MSYKINPSTAYCFTNWTTQKVIDDFQHNPNAGTIIILYRAHLGAGSPEPQGNQLWTTTPITGDSSFYQLTCVETNKVIDIDSKNALVEASSDATKDSQKWAFVAASGSDDTPSWNIQNKSNGLFITVPGGSSQNNTQLQAQGKVDNPNWQRWIAYPIKSL